MTRSTLQRRIAKKNAFDSVEQEASLAVLYVADRIENRLGRLFREYGLTNSQYNVLRILRGQEAPLPALEVAKRMIRVVPAITGLIDRLEKQGLVARRRCEEDRRVIFIEITEQGLTTLDRIDEPLKNLHDELLGEMSKSELTDLTDLLNRAAASVVAD